MPSRWRAAERLGYGADEVALTHNTTEGFNLLAAGSVRRFEDYGTRNRP